MENALVFSDNPVALIGGGDLEPQDITLARQHAPVLVAADGGASQALAAGHLPAAVIGDFDSLRPEDRARIPPDRLFPIGDQYSTDFDKALRHISAPLVLAAGFLGGRVDHQLAAFNVLVRHAHRPCILIGARELVFHIPAHFELELAAGDVVSLFPLAPVTGRSSGLEWPIDGLHLAPDGRIGTSNRALGPVVLRMDGPGLLGMVPRAALEGLIRAIAPSPGAAAP